MKYVWIANNLLLGCFLVYTYFRGHANLDSRVAKGSMTAAQAAYYKRFLRPVSLIGALCSLGVAIMEFIRI